MKEKRTARRFSFSLPVQFQIHGQTAGALHEGKTRNISHRGVFFITDETLKPGTVLDLSVTLPEESLWKGTTVVVHARGEVVRVERMEGKLSGVAAVLQQYEMVRAA